MSNPWKDRRVLVVGASEGIGREFAERAIRAGSRVVIAARRTEALQAVVAAAGDGHVVPVDVTDSAMVSALVEQTVAQLGEIDLILYCTGSASLRRLVDTDRDLWEQTLAVNLIGFNEVARHALGAMAPNGIIAALSSESASQPRDGLIAYAASKAALDVSIRGWRTEHPQIRWSCVAVGATFPTQFGATFDGDMLGPTLDTWVKKGLLQDRFMVPGEVADQLLAMYGGALVAPSVNLDHVVLRSPSPTMGTES